MAGVADAAADNDDDDDDDDDEEEEENGGEAPLTKWFQPDSMPEAAAAERSRCRCLDSHAFGVAIPVLSAQSKRIEDHSPTAAQIHSLPYSGTAVSAEDTVAAKSM